MRSGRFEIYNDHHGHMRLPNADRQREAYELACTAAKFGHDALYRVFGVSGFITAWSVLDGKVTEHRDVTIPAAHWQL